MNTNTKIAVLVGGTSIVGVAAYAIMRAMGNQPSGMILQIQASEGGTTNPAPSPSGISEPTGQVVTITATPNSGYTIGTWLLDGVAVGNGSSIQVTMDMNHSVIVTFWQGGVEPPSYPVAIIAPNSTLVTGYYLCTVELGLLNSVALTRIQNTDQNWTIGNYQKYPVTFKVIDASGKGVPNIPVNLYPDLFPDNSKYRGYIATNDQAISASNPLQLTTDSNGNVTVNVSYWYGISILNDKYSSLSIDAGLYVDGIYWVVAPGRWALWDGWDGTYLGSHILFTGKGGDKTVPNPPTFNNMIAKIPNTSIPQAQAVIYCQLHAKML
jgi:hypothetical protein